MSIVIVGGHDRMHCKYKEICKKYDGNYELYTEGNTYFTSTKIKNISI